MKSRNAALFGSSGVRVAESVEKCLELFPFVGWDFERGQNPAEIRAVIAVVKQADVPPASEGIQEDWHEGSGPLRKTKPTRPLVLDVSSATTNHVADVHLRRLVVGEIERLVAEGYANAPRATSHPHGIRR